MRQAAAVGLVILAIAGICAGSASATVLTSPAWTKVKAGTKIKAEAEGAVKWHLGANTVSCSESFFEAEVTNAGGSESPVKASITTFDFGNCGNYEVKAVKPGTLEIYDDMVMWRGGETTFLRHWELGTTHCIYQLESIIGTLTDSKATNGTGTLDVESQQIPRIVTDGLCDTVTEMTGDYKITTPDSLVVDEVEAPGSILTSPEETKLEVGAEISAQSEGPVEFGGSTSISCEESTLKGKVSNTGGESARAKVALSAFTFSGCGNHTVEVVSPGSLEVHSHGFTPFTGGGLLRSTGAEITVLTHTVFFGTRHCIYTTDDTQIGFLSGSKGTKGTATLDIGPVPLLTAATDGACNNDAEFAGNYEITTPDSLNVDYIPAP